MLKVYHKTISGLEDISKEINNYHSDEKVITYTAADDAIYVGSLYPFNSMYFKIETASTGTVVPTIQYYTSSEFKSVIDIEDNTEGLDQSGIVRFVPDRDAGMARYDSDDISELSGVTVYSKYWFKIVLDVDTSFGLKWLGNIYSDDNSLASEYPDLVRTSVLLAFGAGKTDWEEQAQVAAKVIEKDLISMKVIRDSGQILDTTELELASISKVAEIIYRALGQDFVDQMNAAHKQYKDRINEAIRFIDLNGDARLEPAEYNVSTGLMRR